jgi:hypothetical protein
MAVIVALTSVLCDLPAMSSQQTSQYDIYLLASTKTHPHFHNSITYSRFHHLQAPPPPLHLQSHYRVSSLSRQQKVYSYDEGPQKARRGSRRVLISGRSIFQKAEMTRITSH